MFGNHTRFEVINNGIDLKRFITPENKANEYTSCINARFDPPKNPYFVVDVIDKLVKKESKIILEWIGTGYMEREIKQYTKKNAVGRSYKVFRNNKKCGECVVAQ